MKYDSLFLFWTEFILLTIDHFNYFLLVYIFPAQN